MAEFLLSKCLDVLFDRLLSSDLLNFARLEGIREELDKWRKTMTIIQRVLDDAEEQQRTEKTVKDWLDDLRDLFYDMEDLLDEFATEALHERKLMAGESQASASMVRNLIPSWFTPFTPSDVKFKNRLGSKIEKINTRFNDLVVQKDQLNLKENSNMGPSKRREIRSPSTSLVTEDHIYGREEVRGAILQLLVNEKHSDASNKVPNVIPIVGMGGIGKTTLAQLVYNDKKVESFFNLKAWACVSEDFDVAAVTKTILQSSTSENCDGKDLNWLQEKLKENLRGKRFLVILDDVWNENYNDWTLLRAPFEVGAPRSSIIVTTRNLEVSSLMRNKEVEPFQLKSLSNEACLSIFTQHALEATDFSAHPNLKEIGEELVRRCKGLPLAVKTIAGILRIEDEDSNEWKKVLKNKIWDIPVKTGGIPSSLMVSYDNLPSHLKRCFAYCSILPKDYEFEENEVVLLWMAEGLIQPLQHEEEMEDLGSKYFRNLLSRSFFQQSRINKSQFVMHDLINDLAKSVAGDTCYRMEDRIGSSQNKDIPIKPRHSSYLGSQYDGTKKFEVFSKFTSSLRTFLPLMLRYPGGSYLAHHVHFELVPTLRCLRVLSFKGYCITELPNSIGDLKYLRYLNLSHTRIRFLPESITSLYNLQTLLLEYCFRLKKLPSMLCNLVNLRHLNIENSLEGMPMQIGKLTCLQTLSNLVLGKDSCSGIKELGPLKHLRGTLCISGLENVIESKDAKDAKLIEKTKIDVLSLEWSRDIDESKDTTSELEVLNGLRPHDALAELVIINYGGTKFPNWLTSPSFPHIVSLKLENCYKCTSLPPLGQYLPSLKKLWIKGMAKVKSVGSEFCGRNLETLLFEGMEEWENWSPCEEFPNLRQLSLHKCPKLLGKLPNNLPLLNEVVINDCAVRNLFSLSPISDEGLDMEGLERLTIDSCEELTTLWSDKVGSLPHHLPFLNYLYIDNCPELVSLVAEEVDQERLQLGITNIVIKNCIALESLPKALMYNNMCLLSVWISNCDSLTHFARSHLPPTLKNLTISDCENLRNLVEDDDNDTNNSTTASSSGITSLLEVLYIDNCPSLESLTSSGELPATLQQLTIFSCPKLESVAKSFHHNSFLTTISFNDCPSLESLTSSGEFPATLQRLFIDNCPKLESVAKSFHHNSFLTTISIKYCENLQLLNGGELLLPSNLRELSISHCEKIFNCPSILSFLKEGFPTNLTALSISHPKITEALFDWGLDNLTSLNELEIDGCQHLMSFPERTLPASLTSLYISKFSNLECLSSEGLRKLTSLQTLHIYDCEKLTCFPEDGLPPSLQRLLISGCPLLEERCKKDQRGEWRKIADIPYVEINGRYIYDTETEE